MTKRKAILIGVSLVVVVALGVLLYLVIDRYPARDSEAVGTPTTQPGSVATTEGATPTSYASVDDDGQGYTATGDSYVSDTTSITIAEVETGSGFDRITYFVADVRLTSGTDLRAGLAGNGQDAALTADIAAANDAIFAVNGDYFGARNDGIIIRNGVIHRDEGVRTGLALYEDGHMEIYEEAQTSAQEQLDNGVWNAISFGPGLLLNGEIPDNVSYYEVESNPEWPIQGRAPRTGIGIIDDNHFLFVVVDGRQQGYSRGVTMEELAQIFKDLGCTTAYNLDGGGSSTMYFRGEVVNRPWEQDGGQRAISDILFVG